MVQSFLAMVRRCALRSGLFFGLIFLSARAAAPDPFPGVDAKWRAYESEHFELFTRGSESNARDMLWRLEAMRAFMVSFLELELRHTKPVTIIAFSDDRVFRQYTVTQLGRGDRLLGEYRAYLDRDVIALNGTEARGLEMWTVYTNYAKHVLMSAGGRTDVSWLYQGIGMLFGNFDVNSKAADFGLPDEMRSSLSRRNPKVQLESLLNAEEGRVLRNTQDAADIFHAQSWATLHYLYIGQQEISRRRVNAFLKYCLLDPDSAQPARLRAQFQATFELDYPDMEARLEKYLRRGSFNALRFPLPSVLNAGEIKARAVSAEEIRERLAEVKLRNANDPIGNFALREALGGPRAARAAEVLGTMAVMNSDQQLALELWTRALLGGSRNQMIKRTLIDALMVRWFAQPTTYFRLPAERADELRAITKQARSVWPRDLQAVWLSAWTEAAAPEPDRAVVEQNLLEGAQTPRAKSVLLASAVARLRLGDKPGAHALLDQLATLEPHAGEQAFAEQIRRILGPREEG